MRTSSERRLITESPITHNNPRMQAYIAKEAARPCKQWIHEVLSAKREADRVRLRTSTFVLLPDVDCINKRVKRQEGDGKGENKGDNKGENKGENKGKNKGENKGENSMYPINNPLYFWQGGEKNRIRRHLHHNTLNYNIAATNNLTTQTFHWLAVVVDTSLRTLRDLRGEHVPMLEALHAQSCQKIFEECGTEPGQIMAYVHYPPSVYQLHIHFKHLSGHNVFHDTFRVHPLQSIINNLKIDSDFYKKSYLQLPVYVHTDLYAALATEVTEEPIQICPIQICPIQICPSTTSPGSTPSTPDATSGRASPSATPAREESARPLSPT